MSWLSEHWYLLPALLGAIGLLLKLLKIYVIRHAGSGKTMVGSRLSGSSGAGTKGIIAGSARYGRIVALLSFFVGNWIGIVLLFAISYYLYNWVAV